MASEQDAVNVAEKTLIIQLIESYKDFPCLWDSSHELYSNRDARNQAYEIILQIWRTGYPQATIEEIKKKLENLRAAYRRERKKVDSSKSTGAGAGDVYNPTLWYYPYLSFLSEKTIPISQGIDNSEEPATKREKSSIKRQNALYKKQEELIQSATELIKESNSQEDTSADAFGRSVSSQLKELPKLQRCIVEKMIGELLFYAKLGELSLDASINLNKNMHIDTRLPYCHSLTSTPSPQYFQPSPSPSHSLASQSPIYTTRSPSPQYPISLNKKIYIATNSSNNKIMSSPSPQNSEPATPSLPQTDSVTIYPPSQQYIQPSPSPSHSLASQSPIYTTRSPSPQYPISLNKKIYIATKSSNNKIMSSPSPQNSEPATPSLPQTDSVTIYPANSHSQYLPLSQVILPNTTSVSQVILANTTSASGNSSTQTVFRGTGKELQEFLILKK